MQFWLIVSGVIAAALLAAWLCLRGKRPADSSAHALAGAWRAQAEELARRLAQSPDDDWAWLWRIRLRVLAFLLGRSRDEQPLHAPGRAASTPAAAPAESPELPTKAFDDAAYAAYTRERDRTRMDWSPPWARRGEALTDVLARMKENLGDGPANVEKNYQEFLRQMRRVDLFIGFIGLIICVVVGLLSVGAYTFFQLIYIPAILEIARVGLPTAMLHGIPAGFIVAGVLSANLLTLLMIADELKRSQGWAFLGIFGIVGLVIGLSLRPRR